MINPLIFLDQQFGDSDRPDDEGATPLVWLAVALSCLLTAATAAYGLAHLWVSILG
jgi:hypothetical protein